jgi:hypothetical protein
LIAPPLVMPKGDFGTIAGAVADAIQSSLGVGDERKTNREAERA